MQQGQEQSKSKPDFDADGKTALVASAAAVQKAAEDAVDLGLNLIEAPILAAAGVIDETAAAAEGAEHMARQAAAEIADAAAKAGHAVKNTVAAAEKATKEAAIVVEKEVGQGLVGAGQGLVEAGQELKHSGHILQGSTPKTGPAPSLPQSATAGRSTLVSLVSPDFSLKLSNPPQATERPKNINEFLRRMFEFVREKTMELRNWLNSDKESRSEKAATVAKNLSGATFVWFGTALKFAAFYAAAALVLPGVFVPLVAAIATRYVPVKFAIPLLILNGAATGFGLVVRAALALMVPYSLMVRDQHNVVKETLGEGAEFHVEIDSKRVHALGHTVAEEDDVKVTVKNTIVKREVLRPVNPEIAFAYKQGRDAAETVINRARGYYQAVSERYASRPSPANMA